MLHARRKLLVLVIASISLSGCHPFVRYPQPPIISKHAAIGTVGGAAIGAEVGGAAAVSVLPPAAVGAVIGAGIGTYLTSETHMLKKLFHDCIQVVQTGDCVRIIISSDNLFWDNTASIVPQNYPQLLDVIDFIQNYGPVKLTIHGYTDDIGSPLANQKLSLEQAKSVLAFFWSHGIPMEDLRPIGHGAQGFIANNKNPIGTAYNRRIEVTYGIHGTCEPPEVFAKTIAPNQI